MKIREIAKQLKQENGNAKISQNELTWYIIHQIDNIQEKLSNVVTKDDCKEHRDSIKDSQKTLETKEDNKTRWGLQSVSIVISIIAVVISTAVVIFK